jgi:cyanophycinase
MALSRLTGSVRQMDLQPGMSRDGDLSGLVALVGSGEFLEGMRGVDSELLDGRPQRAVYLPTAAAEEGPDRVRYWVELGRRHFTALGVEPVPLAVLTREDAEREDLAAQVAGAGLVYLSGGNPGYLAHVLSGTAVWRAIHKAWLEGSALGGCSAGACALSRIARDVRQPNRFPNEALAVVPELVVLPHFDRIERWVPGVVEAMLKDVPDDATLVGIDEGTALVGGGRSFVVRGRRSVWLIERDGQRTRLSAGERLEL